MFQTISLQTATLSAVSHPTATNPTNPDPNVISGSDVQPQSSAPIIGGVVGAAVLVCIAVVLAIWFRRKRADSKSGSERGPMETSGDFVVKAFNILPTSSSRPPSANMLEAGKKTAVFEGQGDFLVASQVSPPPEQVTLFDDIEVQPPVRNQDRKIESLSSLKNSMPDHGAFISRNSLTAVNENQMLDHPFPMLSNSQTGQLSVVDFTPSSQSRGGSFHRIALPEDPKDWTKGETAQWIFETFGDAELSSLALRHKINGRALLLMERQDLKSELGLEAFGERILFEEALAELRRRSAQQSSLATESPPSYE
ncbi:hypothetical protein HDU80_009614, partial [Chytriomyces hyalinus]